MKSSHIFPNLKSHFQTLDFLPLDKSIAKKDIQKLKKFIFERLRWHKKLHTTGILTRFEHLSRDVMLLTIWMAQEAASSHRAEVHKSDYEMKEEPMKPCAAVANFIS